MNRFPRAAHRRNGLGDLGDGIWSVAWFEGPDRCDEYYLVSFPPTGQEKAKAVAESLTGS